MKWLCLLASYIPGIVCATPVTLYWQASETPNVKYNAYCNETKLNADLINDLKFTHDFEINTEQTCHVTSFLEASPATAGGVESAPSESITFTVPSKPVKLKVGK